MASSSLARLLLLLVLCPYAAVVSAGRYDPPGAPCYTRLFSLGDSVSDTGNLASVAPNDSVLAFPYGETFFHRPTGRFCDGRLIVDFIGSRTRIPCLASVRPFQRSVDRRPADVHHRECFAAEALKLPLVTPFLAGKTAADFRHGANFAVAGATALGQQFFRDMGLDLAIVPPFSLDVQLEWLERVLHLLGPTEKGTASCSCSSSN